MGSALNRHLFFQLRLTKSRKPILSKPQQVMRKIYLQKVSKELLCEKWESKGTLLGDSELFVRSNKKGEINWDKTVLYFWSDVVKVKDVRQVIYTIPPYPEYLFD